MTGEEQEARREVSSEECRAGSEEKGRRHSSRLFPLGARHSSFMNWSASLVTSWFFAALTLGLSTVPMAACLPRPRSNSAESSKPAENPGPLIAYFFEGQIWTVSPTGSNARLLNLAEESIDEFLWSADGRFLYVALGPRLLGVSIADGAKKEIGVVSAPEGTTVDRLQNSRNPDIILVHTSDADALPHIFSYSLERRETRELTVDEYSALTTIQSPSVRSFSDLSVSPDVTRVLFKAAVGASEELFVGDLEQGSPFRITSLTELEGFEESVETEGGRRIIEAEWSPDGRFVLYNPAQSCSDSGLCYGQLFLTDSWTGVGRRLSQGMMVGLAAAWDSSGKNLLFEDAGKIMITSPTSETRLLAEGNRPKWQPVR